MKRIIFFAFGILIAMLTYFLFEPIFVHNFGWNEFPKQSVSHFSNASAPRYAAAIEKSSTVLENARKELQTPAISVAVGLNNEVVWAEALGFKDIELKEYADTNTAFRIGSTSKAVTSVGLGLLLEQGLLALDAPAQNYVSNYPNKTPISIRQLASHSAGIRNYATCLCFPIWEYHNNDEYETVTSSLAIFQDDDLLFSPGSQFSYSTYNYSVLSAVMESVVNTDFVGYMEQEVFSPLAMGNTSADTQNELVLNCATFYDIEDGKFKKAFKVNNSNKWAGGGFVSTPSDLVRMGNALLNDTFLASKTKAILFEPQRLADGKINEQNYALGWRNDTTMRMFEGKKEVQIIHHGGVAMGSTSMLILFPEYNMTISMLMNRSGSVGDLMKFIYEIAENFVQLENGGLREEFREK